MAVIPTPHRVWFGFLLWIAEKIEAIAWRLELLAQDLSDVWLLGPHLADPLFNLRDWLLDAARWVRDFDLDIRQWLGFLRDIINGWGFTRLLYWVSDEFRQLHTDAQRWVREKVYAISGDLWLIVNAPGSFIRGYIREIVSWWGWFLDNPSDFISSKLSGWFWWWSSFSRDPAYTVTLWLSQRFWWFGRMTEDVSSFIREAIISRYWWFGLLFDNPTEFVKEFIIRMNPSLHSFILNPSRWLRERIAEFFGLPYDFVNRPGYWFAWLIMKNIRDVATSFSYLFENIVIDIIMFFM